MSIKLMSQVWSCELDHSEQSVMLALADHADDDGYRVFPSIALTAWKTGFSPRQVQRIIHDLEAKGLLALVALERQHRAREYRITLDQAKPKLPFRSDKVSPLIPRGDIANYRGDISVPRGDISGSRGDIAMSPESSLEPSLEPSIETSLTTGKNPVGPQAFQLVESDVWAGTPPQELTVPEGGNKARKSTYVERCDQCQVDITQGMDACKACGRPVHWTGSHIADIRYRRANDKRVDEDAIARRAAELRHSEPLHFLLACSRSSPASFKTHFALGEAEALEALVEAYGGQILKDKANEFKANGEQGRGLIKHVLAYLQQYNPSAARSHSAIITDNEELGRQNEAWLVAHGRQSKPEPKEGDDGDDMFAWAAELE